MAKEAKKLTKAEEARRLKNQRIGSIFDSIETVQYHLVYCCICGANEEQSGGTAIGFARQLHKDGWRDGHSKKLNTYGIMCPDCFKKPDANR
jgi:hypothetical protein